ncbi:hypothetical protein G6L68_10285 [Agrobacterium fabrum]|uniref:hypothetical protein n=1 Tax=Agrobacterium fabrum TaxID=1176649 RepID=UPI000EF611F5|nr:hypothetical protein [Agrobacterium fabrum]AYM62932.1 hypothetical protein At12D13_17670 [Agrobacterium fabrum]NTE61031.1 hypothetical protein [Agrobacterium fabrum]
MPNASIPATAEGMTEFHAEKRIAELATEIAGLMDRTRKLGNLTVFAASSGIKARYEAEVLLEGPALSSTLIKGIDQLNEGRSYVDLVNLALESLSGDANIQTEINALQYGMHQIGVSLLSAKQEFEKAHSIANNG